MNLINNLLDYIEKNIQTIVSIGCGIFAIKIGISILLDAQYYSYHAGQTLDMSSIQYPFAVVLLLFGAALLWAVFRKFGKK